MAAVGPRPIVHAIQRSKTHDSLLKVMATIGAWERFGIELQSRYVPTGEVDLDALDEHVKSGEVDLIFGHHFTPYAGLARPESPRYVCMASISNGCPDVICTRPEISSLSQLRGRRIGVQGHHPRELVWHMLKQQGIDVDKGEAEFVRVPASSDALRQLKDFLLEGKVDAAFLSPPFDLEASQAGFRVLEETRFYPNIMGGTLTTTAQWMRNNRETAKNLIKAMVYGIYYLKTHPDDCLDILGSQSDLHGDTSLDQTKVRYIYDLQVRALAEKPYPTALAIYNTFEEAKHAYRNVPGLERINPIAIWDIHLLRELDDEGFIDNLYSGKA